MINFSRANFGSRRTARSLLKLGILANISEVSRVGEKTFHHGPFVLQLHDGQGHDTA
jgi:hypothetical protein